MATTTTTTTAAAAAAAAAAAKRRSTGVPPAPVPSSQLHAVPAVPAVPPIPGRAVVGIQPPDPNRARNYVGGYDGSAIEDEVFSDDDAHGPPGQSYDDDDDGEFVSGDDASSVLSDDLSNDHSQGSFDDDFDEDDEEGGGQVVRQESSFKRLSKDSWLTVVSEYEDNDKDGNLLFSQVEEVPKKKDPVELEQVRMMKDASSMEGRSVLDCVVDLLRGTRAQKKKMLRRYGERWIWLGEDLLSLNWKSKKRGADTGRINLTRVKKLKGTQRDLVVESNDGHKLTLNLGTKEESTVWLTGLSCLVPKKAKVTNAGRLLKARVNYDPLRDSWRGKAVATRKHVNQYIMLGEIGRGSFGKVKLALSMHDKRFYAVKVIANNNKTAMTASLRNPEEQAMLRKLDHPNIVRHRDFLHDAKGDRYIVVVEYMARGVVMSSGKLEGVKPLAEDGVREIMRDVVAGLEYLHYQRIVHRDIKPDNLLRAGDGTVKVSDFGEAKMYTIKTQGRGKSASPGTPAFIAPELCMSEKSPKAPPEGYPADVWSLGATLFYMVYGRVPFLARDIFEVYDMICTQKLKFPDQPKVSKPLKDLIKKMLTKEPKSRATLHDVAKHPWFNGKVTQEKELKKIRLTKADINAAVSPAEWNNKSHSSQSSD